MTEEKVRILLVEDNDDDAYLFSKALETAELNCELTVLVDGAEALAFVRREGKYAECRSPDLAVIDMNLPKNEGVEVLQAIRQNKVFSSMPVVITSSSTSQRERTRVEHFGIETYIIKPPNLEEFLQVGFLLKQILHEKKAAKLSSLP